MVGRLLQVLLVLKYFSSCLTASIYVDSSITSSGDGSAAAPLKSLEEALTIVSNAAADSNTIFLLTNTSPYRIVSAWSLSKSYTVKYQGSADTEVAQVLFEEKGRISLNGLPSKGQWERISFKQPSGTFEPKELFLLDSGASLTLEGCYIGSLISTTQLIFINAIKAGDILLSNSEVSGLTGNGWTHIILAIEATSVKFNAFKIKDNTLSNQLILEARQNSNVALSNSIISNNVVKGVSSEKPGFLINVVSSLRIEKTVLEKNLLISSTLFNVTASGSSSNTLEISSSTFSKNTGSDGLAVLLIASNTNLKIVLNSVTLQNNYAIGSLFEFRDTLASADFDSVSVLKNFATQAILFSLVSNININNFLCSENNIDSQQFVNLQNPNRYPGPCLLISDYKTLYIVKANVLGNFAVSSITGIALQHTTKTESSSLVSASLIASLDQFVCENNIVMNNNTFLTLSGNCLYISIQGNIKLNNSAIRNNQVQYMHDSNDAYGGNPCVSSDGLTASMTVRNSVFSGNKAYSECMCFKFDGYLIDIQDSVFNLNTGVDVKDYFGAEGGSLYLGADNMILKNLTLMNSSSAKGAGIFFHNKFQKKYQSLVAYQVNISFNRGIQTSGLDFDASLLTGLFNFTNCSVSDNAVEFYGVISTFYFTEVMVHFIRCRFERNEGLSAGGAMSLYHFGGLIFINNSIFYKNSLRKNVFVGGSAVFLYGTTYLCLVYVNSTLFEENYSDLKGGAVATMFGTLHCYNCTFLENYAKYGGAVNLAVYCPGSYTNSRFISKKTSTYGGGIFTADEAVLKIINTTFEGLSAQYGGAIKMDGLLLTLTMENVTFLGNIAERGAAVDFSNTLKIFINMTNIILIKNKCLDSILNLGNLALYVQNLVLQNNSGRIFQMKTVVIRINGLRIENHECRGSEVIGCGGYLQEATDAMINNTNISNVLSEFIQDFFSLSDSSLYMENCSMKGIASSSKTLFLFGRTSTASLKNIEIQAVDGEILNFEESDLAITGLQLSNSKNSKSDFGTIYCSSCSLLTIDRSVFNQINGAKYGGVVYVSGSIGVVRISNSLFNKCSSSAMGGSLYIKQSNISISGSNFTNNQADEHGGAAYFECDKSTKCEWSLQKNAFKGNSAKTKGGAYHSVSYIPLGRETNSFENNSAAYGPDYSSFPVRLTLETIAQIKSEKETVETMVPLDCEVMPENCVIVEVASGQILPWVSFAIIDTYGQKMILEEGLAFFDFSKDEDFERKNTLYASEKNSSLSMPIQNLSLQDKTVNFSNLSKRVDETKLPLAQEVLVKGVKTVQSKGGSFNFSEIQIQAEPSSFTNIKIKSDLIPEYMPVYLSKNSSFDQAEQNTKEYAFRLTAYLRKCQRGEIYRLVQTSNICYKCPKNQYSLDIQDKECLLCPLHAACEGGDRIIVEKGFWRSSSNSTRIYSCNPMSDPCLGGYDSECIPGHTGNLCGNCIFSGQDKWFKKGIYFCERCGNLYIYIIVLVIGVLVIFGFIIYLIMSRKNQDTENYLLVKMMTTHIQTISFVSNIKITLPTALSNMNSVQAPATSTESFVFAFECFKDNFSSSIYAIKLISSVAILMFITLIVNIVYISIGLFKKQNRKKIIENLVNALVIIYSFFQPSFINFYIQNLSCDEIDGKQFLTFNLDEECWNGTHYALSGLITIPMLLFWMIIFPGLFLFYIFRNRARLDDDFVFQITRFFQIGYKRKFFFWEFLNMLRKFMIILLTTFLRNNQQVVIYILIPVMASFFFMQNYARPFEHPRHNRLEIISLNAAFLTYYSAVFYIRSITDEAKLFFLAVILISNIVYFIYWIRQYLGIVKRKVKGVVSSIRNAARKITESSSPTSKKFRSSAVKTQKSVGEQGSRVENIND